MDVLETLDGLALVQSSAARAAHRELRSLLRPRTAAGAVRRDDNQQFGGQTASLGRRRSSGQQRAQAGGGFDHLPAGALQAVVRHH